MARTGENRGLGSAPRPVRPFHNQGIVAPSQYFIEGGVIKPSPQDVLRNPILYEPSEEPQMLIDFVNLGQKGAEGFLEYESDWGPLGYDEVSSEAKPAGGDPLRFLEYHHYRLSLFLKIISALQSGKSDTNWLGIIYQEANTELAGIRLQLRPVFNPIPSDVLENVREYGVEATADISGLVLQLSWQAPLHVLYWHLARLAAGTYDMGQCEECANYFIQTRKWQKYCPPRNFEGFGTKQSRCGLKRRTRNRRARLAGC